MKDERDSIIDNMNIQILNYKEKIAKVDVHVNQAAIEVEIEEL